MNGQFIFTRRFLGIDRNVWLLLFITILLTSGLYGYSIITRKPETACKDLQIQINDQLNLPNQPIYVGEPVGLRIAGAIGDIGNWDFGDGKSKRNGPLTTQHVYDYAGTFNVSVEVNNTCYYKKTIEIKRPIIRPISDPLPIDSIINDPLIIARKKAIFRYSRKSTNNQWMIEFYPKSIHKGDSLVYTFKAEGDYTVILTLANGQQVKKNITVLKNTDTLAIPQTRRLIPDPEPIGKEPEKESIPEQTAASDAKDKTVSPNIIFITDEQLKMHLQNVGCGITPAGALDKYLCSGGETKVSVKKKGSMFLKELLLKIGKKTRINSVKTVRDSDNNKCIILLEIEYDNVNPLIKIAKGPCE